MRLDLHAGPRRRRDRARAPARRPRPSSGACTVVDPHGPERRGQVPQRPAGDLRRRWRVPAAATTRPPRSPVDAQADRPTSRSSAQPQNRVDALDIVTGRKKFADGPRRPERAADDGLPAADDQRHGQVRSPTWPPCGRCPASPTSRSVRTGVAVRAQTFGQCIDAVRALDVTGVGGTVDGQSDADRRCRRSRSAEIPLAVPKLGRAHQDRRRRVHVLLPQQQPAGDRTARSPTSARTAPRSGAACKSPIVAQSEIAAHARPAAERGDRATSSRAAARSAATCSTTPRSRRPRARKAMGKPVQADVAPHRRLPARPRPTRWHDPRCARRTPRDEVLTYEQRHTSVATDFSHGLGRDHHRAAPASCPSATPRLLRDDLRADPGRALQLRRHRPAAQRGRRCGFHTGSMRNIYSPDVAAARELIVDQLAKTMGKDPYQFRRAFLKDARGRGRCSTRSPQVGDWGRSMPAGTAQGIAFHEEYKGVDACLVEIDCRPETVNRADPRRRHRPARHQGRVRRRRRPGHQPARPRGADAWAGSWTASRRR